MDFERDLVVLAFELPALAASDDGEDGGDCAAPCTTVKLSAASSAAILSLTRRSHPSFGLRCFTGLQVYSGAEVLSSLFLRRPAVLRSGARDVLELGCGIGLAGVAAARALRPTQRLALTDGETDAIRLAALNVRDNANPNITVTAQCAEWSEGGAAALSSALALCWQPSPAFSAVFGSDLFYARTSVSALLRFALTFLAPGGHVVLAHTPRRARLHEELRSEAARAGLCMGYVPLLDFLSAHELSARGWSAVEVAVLAREADWPAVQRAAYGWATLSAASDRERADSEESARLREDDAAALRALGLEQSDLS